MAGILARVRILHEKGADLAYMYEKELLGNIGLTPRKINPEETFFNIGDEITLGEDKYKVVNIHTRFFKTTYEPDNFGIDISGVGEILPYNFQITYVVTEI